MAEDVGRRVTKRRRYVLLIAALALLMVAERANLLMLCIGTAAAQNVLPRDFIVDSRAFLDSCPPGHRIQFQSDAISLYVDPHWLDTYTLIKLAERFRNHCPTEPVQAGPGLINPLFFNRSIISAAQITPTSLGSSYFQLIIAFIPQREDKPFPGTHREPVQQSTVVELPPLPERTKSQPPNKIYELRYPDDGTGSSTVVRMSCSGGGPQTLGKRSCFTVTTYDTPYRYRGVLSVYYHMSHPHSAEGALSEGEAVLTFDRRIRAWIDSMLTQP
jgi:hypothetical protein